MKNSKKGDFYDPRKYQLNDDETAFNVYVKPWDEPFKQIATGTNKGYYLGFKLYNPLGYKPKDTNFTRGSSEKRVWDTQQKFYQKCMDDKIPIMAHCTPEGMYNHQRPLFYNMDDKTVAIEPSTEQKTLLHRINETKEKIKKLEKEKELLAEKGYNSSVSGSKQDSNLKERMRCNKTLEFLNSEYKIAWFSQNYVSPYAWEVVLKEFSSLNLCLAHFGGKDWDLWKEEVEQGTWFATQRKRQSVDEWYNEKYSFMENDDITKKISDGSFKNGNWIRKIIELTTSQTFPNVYTDISYFLLKNNRKQFQWLLEDLFKNDQKRAETLIKKIIFGTDWWVVEGTKTDYSEYANDAKMHLDEIDKILRAKGYLKSNNPTLWKSFTQYNPMRFYRLKEVVQSMGDGLLAFIGEENENIIKRHVNRILQIGTGI